MAPNSCFQSISEMKFKSLLTSKNSKSTDKTIKTAINKFRCLLRENSNSTDFEHFNKKQLNDSLKLFFASIKKQGENTSEDGGLYKKNA